MSVLLDLALPPLATTEDHELPLYPCGTYAPGHVHDPCQHSLLTVLCCTCAGCMFDAWSCGQDLVTDPAPWWDVDQIAAWADPWVRHRYALVLYALIVVVLLASRVVQMVLEILLIMSALGFAAVIYVLTQTFT